MTPIWSQFTTHLTILVALGLILLSATPAFADSSVSKKRQVTQLAPGIYEIRHQDATDNWPNGNTTVIIGDREVFIVDSCYLPSAAREDIAEIRKLTDKPVRYLLNTHWHYDHNNGNKSYMDAFPSLEIIAHAETRRAMDEHNRAWVASVVRPDSDSGKNRAQLKKDIDTGKDKDGKVLTGAERAEAEENLALEENEVNEFKTLVYQPPTLTYDHELNIDLGNREVQVKHLGRGNTAGDSLIYLPKEKILVTGDLLVHPVPYAFGGFPTEWIRTLQSMAQLDALTIVPGHGEILHDKTYIYEVINLLKTVVVQVNEQVSHGAKLDETKKGVDLTLFRRKMAGDDKDDNDLFDASIIEGLIKIAYNEANGQ